MTPNRTTLYDYWRSSASYRVRIALGLSGEPWQTVGLDLLEGVHKSAGHLARNPQGLVPVLDIDGHRFTQSLAIIEYLDETRRLGLLPEDPAAKAWVRALCYAIAMEIHPVCNLSVAQWAADQSGGALTAEAWMQKFIGSGLAAYEMMLGEDRYSFGASVSLADICLAPQVYNARRWGVDLAECPKILRIDDALACIPAFEAAHPDRCPR